MIVLTFNPHYCLRIKIPDRTIMCGFITRTVETIFERNNLKQMFCKRNSLQFITITITHTEHTDAIANGADQEVDPPLPIITTIIVAANTPLIRNRKNRDLPTKRKKSLPRQRSVLKRGRQRRRWLQVQGRSCLLNKLRR